MVRNDKTFVEISTAKDKIISNNYDESLGFLNVPRRTDVVTNTLHHHQRTGLVLRYRRFNRQTDIKSKRYKCKQSNSFVD